MTKSRLITQAEEILRRNHQGNYTAPSLRLYPHLWNWDSALVTLGWAQLDWAKAEQEVDALLTAQWKDGFLPHIRYNPDVVGYHPGPEWWPNTPVRIPGQRTSGISQPPLLPTAVYLAGMVQPDERIRRGWWSRLFDSLREVLLVYPRIRTVDGSPLLVLVHPWESGSDNSPRWDFVMGRGFKPSRPYRRIDTQVVDPAQRPTDRDYDLYMFLVELIANHGYDFHRYFPMTPFAVYDALFNAAWYRAALDLNRIAMTLGKAPAVGEQTLRRFKEAYHSTLWDEGSGLFRDYDLKAGTQIPVDTFAGLTAIYGGLVERDQAEKMFTGYLHRCRGYGRVPSVPPDQPGFEADRYWRGPIWVNVNWFIIRGLQEMGLTADAQALAEETIALVQGAGWREFFHAQTGEGLGGRDFSWTAALIVDLLARPVVPPRYGEHDGMAAQW